MHNLTIPIQNKKPGLGASYTIRPGNGEVTCVGDFRGNFVCYIFPFLHFLLRKLRLATP